MPVYGVEKYLRKAMDSVLQQTLTDFEFYAVDDGSPDGCGRILDEYAAKDTRVRVIHKENGGAPSARNTAIEKAQGEYLYFMDSDDWAEPKMLEDMVREADRHQAELVVTGFYIDTYYADDKKVVESCTWKDRVYESANAFHAEAHELFDRSLLYTPWNKLYRRSYIMERGIRFPNTFRDDMPFNLWVLSDVSRVVVMSRQYYHFLKARQESETARYRSDLFDKREQEHEWMLGLYEHWHYMSAPAREMLARRYMERLLGCVENVTSRACKASPKEKRRLLQKMICRERVQTEMRLTRPHSVLMRIFLWPVGHGYVHVAYWMGTFISVVKQHNTKLFSTIKAHR